MVRKYSGRGRGMDERLFFPATKKNTIPIGNVLSSIIPRSGYVLEVASGSGEHAVAFQKRFPNISWQTSDPNPIYRRSISAWIEHYGLSNIMRDPIDINVEIRPWDLKKSVESSIEAIICINMLHISPWSSAKALFAESKRLLEKNKLLIIYGPFKIKGKHTSKSNLLFDKTLRGQNILWGVRDLEVITEIAKNNGIEITEIIKMPANNLLVIFKGG